METGGNQPTARSDLAVRSIDARRADVYQSFGPGDIHPRRQREQVLRRRIDGLHRRESRGKHFSRSPHSAERDLHQTSEEHRLTDSDTSPSASRTSRSTARIQRVVGLQAIDRRSSREQWNCLRGSDRETSAGSRADEDASRRRRTAHVGHQRQARECLVRSPRQHLEEELTQCKSAHLTATINFDNQEKKLQQQLTLKEKQLISIATNVRSSLARRKSVVQRASLF